MWIDNIQRLKDDIYLWLSRPAPETGSQSVDLLSSAIATAKGNTRQENQDCALAAHYCSEPHGPTVTAFVLCDGIGGMRDGGTCARLAAAMFVASLVGHRLEKALSRGIRAARAANDEIFQRYKEDGGTTLSCLIFQAQETTGLNVGDSRIYRFGPNRCSQLTVDDTIASQMQHLRPSEPTVSNPSFGKQLTQFIGMGSEVQFRPLELQNSESDGAGFLLTSDGVHSMNTDTLREITTCAKTPLDVVKRLTAIARWGRGNDNGSAICVSRLGELLPRAFSSSGERLLVWDSHSRLDVLLDTRAWEKEGRRARLTGKRSKSRKMRDRNVRENAPDLHALPTNKNASSDASDRGDDTKSGVDRPRVKEPLQLEIVEHPDDKPTD